MKRSKKAGLSVLVFLIFMGMIALSANAASVYKSLQVKYGVQVVYNNKVVSGTEAPFISGGRTYVPLRMLMNTFGDKMISWDAVNQRVIITDADNSIMYQLAEKDAEIEDLEEEINDLEEEINDLQNEVKDLEGEITDWEDGNSSTDSSDLEDYLTDEYEDDFTSIALSGDEDDIRITLKTDESDWDSFSVSEKENLLQDICDDIWYDFEDADIIGTVKEGSSVLQTFEASAGDEVFLGDDFDSLIDDITDSYEYDWRDARLPFNLTVTGDARDITFKISFNYNIYESHWSDLSDTEIRNMMDDIRDTIADEYDDADILGYVYDSSGEHNLAKYGDAGLTRYH